MATAATVLAVATPVPAWAEATPGPVRGLTAPVADLHTGVSSLDGTVTVEGTRRGAKARIDATVLFGKDSAVLRPGARDRIRQVAKEFARTGPGKVLVTGYTDDLGPADHGLRLSIRRAGIVADTLTGLLPRSGYPMTAVGKGEQDPAVPNDSEVNRRKNRRVIITLDRAATGKTGSKSQVPVDKPNPNPTRATAPAATAPPTTASTPPSQTAAAPTPTPTAGTPTGSPTNSPSSVPDVTAPPARAPADSGLDRGQFFDPVVVSNLFLVAVLLAATVLALRQHLRRPGRPDSPDPAGPTGPSTPPANPGNAEGARAPIGTEAAGPAAHQREDGPRPTEAPAPPPADPAGAAHTSRAPDLHTPNCRTAVEYVAVAHGARAEQPDPPTAPVAAISNLDADLRAWHSDRCDLPRLSLLGPVTVRAHGAPLARRRPFYTELLTFLALRPHGATPDQVADAFTLTPARVRNDMKVLRDWLGTNPRTGRRHLPDARDTAAGRARGLAVYQAEGLLVDLDLFDRLVKRAEAVGADGAAYLEQALRLVRGQPFDQLRPHGWAWLYEGDRVDLHTEAAIQRVSDRAADLRGRTPDADPPPGRQAGRAAC